MSTRHCSEFPHWDGGIFLPESFSSPSDPNPQSHAGLCLSSDFPPFPPSLTSSRKFLPGNKNLNVSSTLTPCPKLYVLIVFLGYFFLLLLSYIINCDIHVANLGKPQRLGGNKSCPFKKIPGSLFLFPLVSLGCHHKINGLG